jgi:thioredoxin 2
MSATTLDEKGIILPCPQCGKKNRIPYERLGEAGQCGHCGTSLPPLSEPVDVPNEAVFERLAGSSALPVAVDFWAPWCGPCKMMAPEFAKAARSGAGTFLAAKVNTEALPALGQRFHVASIPTLAVYHRGRELARDAGARPAPAIEAFIRAAIS